jgi:putative intracellular protease/amidase
LLSLPLAAQAQKVYVCPMPEHPQVFTHPGSCPLCGMKLVERDKQFRVAVLLFDSVEDIDFTAPIEVFGEAGARVFTVAASTKPIRTVFGLKVTPEYDLQHAPAADLVLIPGGGVGDVMKDARVLQWIRQRAETSRYILSVCNGAFTLANTGLLDGLSATTTAGRIDELASKAPKVHLVRERFVDNGKIITAAGLSAGIDGALHVLDREYGRTRAEEIARHLEYRWQPESRWTRSLDADTRLPNIKLPDDASWETITSEGDTSQWKMSGRLHIAMKSDEVLDYVTKQITASGWTLRESPQGTRTFARKDGEGQTWITTIASAPDAEASALLETVTIAKE